MKRFTETEKWRDPWFQKLSIENRTLWLWLCDRVDNSGVIDICWPICNAETSLTFTEEAMNSFGDRVEKLSNGKWWIPKFTLFQFGELSTDQKHKVHASIIKLLKIHSLTDRVGYRVSHTPKEKDKEKDKDKDKENVVIKINHYSDDFIKAWSVYPNKNGKSEAFKAWNKFKPNEELVKTILRSIDLQKKWPQWTKDNGQYIPHFSTWMNQMKWEDEGIIYKPVSISKAPPSGDQILNSYKK